MTTLDTPMHEAIEPGSRIMVRGDSSDDLGRHIEGPTCEQARVATFDDEDNEVTPYWECPSYDLDYYVVVKVHTPECLYYAGDVVPHTIGGKTRPLQQWLHVESRDEVPEGKELRVIEARSYESLCCLACAVQASVITEAEIKANAGAHQEYEYCKAEAAQT
jgi:hypothetical protein